MYQKYYYLKLTSTNNIDKECNNSIYEWYNLLIILIKDFPIIHVWIFLIIEFFSK